MESLKEIRIDKKLTQKQAADLVGISLRSYKSYENEEDKFATLKYEYIIKKIQEMLKVDEEHGILTIDEIKEKCSIVFNKYKVKYCYLFGSYAKGKAKPNSDVDFLIDTEETGFRFFGIVEDLRNSLNKEVDVLDINQLNNNLELTREILSDGIKIYG